MKSSISSVLKRSLLTGLVPVYLLALFLPISTIDAAGVREVTPDTRPETIPLDAQLPFSDRVRRGRLDNGLQYFLRSHAHPENTIVLRLIVDTGSVLEEENERGLAHFVEHMAFNGTEDFPEGELVAYLESLGMRFGPDVNAYTGFDETVYKLEIPADDEEALNQGFRVMQQWASAIIFEQDAIESERGVIVEEWRRGRGAAARIQDQHIPVLLKDSRYAERLPIGDMEIVRNAPRERLTRFFDRWYRPDNMALVAVGDLPLDRLETLVQTHLTTIRSAKRSLQRPYYFVPSHEGTRVSIASDPEATRSTVAIYIPGRPDPMQRVGDYRHVLVRSLFSSIVNERLREIARDPDAPVSGARVGWSRMLRDTEITVASALARDERVQDALEVLVTELERAERYGVLERELERARARFMQWIEDALANARTRSSGSLADELVRHWTQGEAVPGIEFEYRLYEQLLPSIDLAEINEVAGRFTLADNRVVLAGLRDDGKPIPAIDDLLDVLHRTEERAITPPAPEEQHSLLLTEEPDAGKIVEITEHPEVETYEYTLANGMRLYVRPSDLRDDEILFSAFSPGGLSLVPDELVPAARIASQVARESGIGTLDATALERALTGRNVEFATAIGESSERMSGSTRQTDLEQLFQIVHLAFTAPRFEQRALETVRRQHIQRIRGAESSPQGIFSRRFQTMYAAGDPRRKPLTETALNDVTLSDVEDVYRNRFSDPADFALFFAGNLELTRVEELAQRYLATIRSDATSRPRNERGFLDSVRDTGYSLPPDVIEETIHAGTEPVAQVGIVFHNDYEWSRRENHRFNSLSDLLSIRLREEIREEAGGTYGVGAAGWRRRDPEPRAFMQVFFGMDPDRSEELIAHTFNVIEEIRRRPTDADYLQRIKAQQRESHRRSLRENSYWLSVLEFSVEHGRDLSLIPEFPRLIDELTVEDIHEVAKRYLDPRRRMQLLLLPAAP